MMGSKNVGRLVLVVSLSAAVAGAGACGTHDSTSSDGGGDSSRSNGASGGSGSGSGSGALSDAGKDADGTVDAADTVDDDADSSDLLETTVADGVPPDDGPDDAAASGTYQCTVTQVRAAGDCATAWPQGLGGAGSTFSMTVVVNRVQVPGSLDCTGTWRGNEFVCTITAMSGGGGPSCPGVPWVLLTSGNPPNNAAPLQTGQIWAGTYVPPQPDHGFDAGGSTNNAFNAECQHPD